MISTQILARALPSEPKNDTHESEMTPSNSLTALGLKDATNITPERRDKWLTELSKTVSALPKGTIACEVLVGSDADVNATAINHQNLVVNRVQLAKREIARHVSCFFHHILCNNHS